MKVQTIRVRNLTLGDGIPKICVPITAKNETELQTQLRTVKETEYDLVEWRADFYEATEDPQWPETVLALLRKELGDCPILFTFRTKEEGGERSISMEEYEMLTLRAVRAGADLADIELNRGEERMRRMAEQIHANGGVLVGSFHDFQATPSKDTIVEILCRIAKCSADIPKVAVMPANDLDVMTLLEASVTMKNEFATGPFVTMSMSRTGSISRLSGSLTGSAFTFATAGSASAPGQFDAGLMRQILSVL